MFENPRRGRQARNFTANVPKILELKTSSEQIFFENSRRVPLKKAGKNKLVLSSVSDLYKLQTPFTALVQKPETRKMNEFLKETIFFFIFCFSFLLFVFKFRATGVLCFPNNRKYKSDRMLNFSLMRSAF